jgi:3-deoxy-7-phosphoheptulonate synthase
MKACGMHDEMGVMNETEFYTSHECLLLDYEEALTRQDSTTNQWCVTHAPSHALCHAERTVPL